MSVDDAQDSRLAAIEARLIEVERAVIEIAALNKIIKLIAISLAASFGMDIHGVL
jgi:hypothetical protein|tara:strand:- start:1931 stop:2095 length:165 start_codon:yes stop_codon:yes gene_type:complete